MGNPNIRKVIGIRSAKPSHREVDDANYPTPSVWFHSWRQLAGLLSDENRALSRTPRTLEGYGLVTSCAPQPRYPRCAPGGASHRISQGAGLTRTATEPQEQHMANGKDKNNGGNLSLTTTGGRVVQNRRQAARQHGAQ
jgi:hypothetical protein